MQLHSYGITRRCWMPTCMQVCLARLAEPSLMLTGTRERLRPSKSGPKRRLKQARKKPAEGPSQGSPQRSCSRACHCFVGRCLFLHDSWGMKKQDGHACWTSEAGLLIGSRRGQGFPFIVLVHQCESHCVRCGCFLLLAHGSCPLLQTCCPKVRQPCSSMRHRSHHLVSRLSYRCSAPLFPGSQTVKHRFQSCTAKLYLLLQRF